MSEYIIRETGYPGAVKQEVVGKLVLRKECKHRDDDDFCTGRGYPNLLVPDDGFCDKGERSENG